MDLLRRRILRHCRSNLAGTSLVCHWFSPVIPVAPSRVLDSLEGEAFGLGLGLEHGLGGEAFGLGLRLEHGLGDEAFRFGLGLACLGGEAFGVLLRLAGLGGEVSEAVVGVSSFWVDRKGVGSESEGKVG